MATDMNYALICFPNKYNIPSIPYMYFTAHNRLPLTTFKSPVTAMRYRLCFENFMSFYSVFWRIDERFALIRLTTSP